MAELSRPVVIASPSRALLLEPVQQHLGLRPFVLTEGCRCLIGSAPEATLRVQVPGAQPEHCTLEVRGDRVLVTQWGPQTWLNDKPVRISEEIRGDDVLGIGIAEFRLRKYEPEQSDFLNQPEAGTAWDSLPLAEPIFVAAPPEPEPVPPVVPDSIPGAPDLQSLLQGMEVAIRNLKNRKQVSREVIPLQEHREQIEVLLQRETDLLLEQAALRQRIQELEPSAEEKLQRQQQKARLHARESALAEQTEGNRLWEARLLALQLELHQKEARLRERAVKLQAELTLMETEQFRLSQWEAELRDRDTEQRHQNSQARQQLLDLATQVHRLHQQLAELE